MSTNNGIFYRPIHCGECGANFDYPTVTMDARERGVPITTRICLDCLAKFDKDEDKRRVWAEKTERLNGRKPKDESSHDYKWSNGSIATSDHNLSDSDAISQATESPEQSHARPLRGRDPKAPSHTDNRQKTDPN